MKKLLALSGLGSSVAFWATSMLIPHIVSILLVLFFASSLGGYTFASSGVGNTIVSFAQSFFSAGGITAPELVIGL